MKEAFIEKKLRLAVERVGGKCEKFTTPGTRDVPDRLVTWPWGEMDLVETKAPGKKPRAGQIRDHKARAKLGVPVFLIDNVEDVFRYAHTRTLPKHPYPEYLFSVGPVSWQSREMRPERIFQRPVVLVDNGRGFE